MRLGLHVLVYNAFSKARKAAMTIINPKNSGNASISETSKLDV
jgi:hypothetical protein